MDIGLFEKSLEEGKAEHAAALLKTYLQEPLTEEEQGGLYAAFAVAYMKAKNSINTDYLAQLNEIAASLKTLRKTEQKLDDEIGLSEVRKQLS